MRPDRRLLPLVIPNLDVHPFENTTETNLTNSNIHMNL